MEREIIVTEKFAEDAKKIYDYIHKESSQNATKFKNELLLQMEKVEKQPASYPLIDYKDFDNSSKEYRFSHFFKSFKIIFKLTITVLTFLGIVHDRQSSEALQKRADGI